MTIPQETARAVASVTEGLKAQPLALALVVMNVVFIGFTYLIFHELNSRTIHQYDVKDQLIERLIELCDGKVR